MYPSPIERLQQMAQELSLSVPYQAIHYFSDEAEIDELSTDEPEVPLSYRALCEVKSLASSNLTPEIAKPALEVLGHLYRVCGPEYAQELKLLEIRFLIAHYRSLSKDDSMTRIEYLNSIKTALSDFTKLNATELRTGTHLRKAEFCQLIKDAYEIDDFGLSELFEQFSLCIGLPALAFHKSKDRAVCTLKTDQCRAMLQMLYGWGNPDQRAAES